MRKVMLFLVMMSMMLWATPAFAHPLGYEADDNNNRVVTFCFAASAEPEQIQDYRDAANASQGWDKFNAVYGSSMPNLTEVSSLSYPTCEVVIKQGTLNGPAELYSGFLGGQDNIVVDWQEWNNASARVRQFIASHSTGHTLGFDHPGNMVTCAESVMKNGSECTTATVSPFPQDEHDGRDMNGLWGPGGQYPN